MEPTPRLYEATGNTHTHRSELTAWGWVKRSKNSYVILINDDDDTPIEAVRKIEGVDINEHRNQDKKQRQ